MSQLPMNATTLASPGEIEHAEATAFGLNPGGWVALSMIVVIALLIWKGAPKAIGRSLDKKIASIREQLDEASKLRAEAEALKAEYEAKAKAAHGEAAAIVAHARAEADALLAKGKEDTELLVQRRGRMAEDKIAAAERTAIAEVRAKAADAAAKAAAMLIAERHDTGNDRALVDRTIANLGQRLN
ncbi:F0F1 ATP synthase subunit B [uncultured Sphingomonas sp.]|uniref:F0F1 ATP synthase subunit B family protein n=1 Tax=uncultured Sphingomonas sp. TaxID=158754 RepID=UPI0025D55A62|nr:F0F1 ATP synthase subunit B [uncultured Sphingomonas sp.]